MTDGASLDHFSVHVPCHEQVCELFKVQKNNQSASFCKEAALVVIVVVVVVVVVGPHEQPSPARNSVSKL